MPQTDADVPTTSTLLFLFADEVAPLDTALTQGVGVPCKDVKVQLKALAGVMLAATFAGLRDRELVALEVVQQKALLRKTTHVQVTPVRALDRPGMEGGLLRAAAGGPRTVRDLVRAWFGRDRFNPWQDIVETATDEGESLGLFRSVDAERGKLAGYVLGRSKLEADCARIAQLRPAFVEAHSLWQRFERDEPALFAALGKTCAKAIASREQPDTS